MSGDTEGWITEPPYISPEGHWCFDYWVKNISTACSGILFRITRVRGREIDAYELGIVDVWASVATRSTLEECQVLAHETARLWAGEKK